MLIIYFLSFSMVYRTLTFPYQSSYLEIIFHSNPQGGKSKNSPPNSCGAREGEIHTWAVDPSSRLPAGSAPFNLSMVSGAVGGLLFPQQMVSRIRGSLFQVHWVSKWEWGPSLLIWLCIRAAFQPRRQRQWICTLIHSMPTYGIRKKRKKNVFVITHYSYPDTEPVGPCHHIFQEILRDPSYLVNASVNVWGHATFHAAWNRKS